MLAEFWNTLTEHFNARRQLDVIHVPGRPRDYWTHSRVNGDVEAHEVQKPRAKEVVLNIDDLIASVKNGSAVFVSDRDVVVLHDADGWRDQRITMPMTTTEQFKKLFESPAKPLEHKALIRALRTESHGKPQHGLLDQLTALRFDSSKQGESRITGGDESLSAAVKTAVYGSQSERLPERITMKVRPFEQWPEVYDVPCVLDVDVDAIKPTFTIIPCAGSKTDMVGQALCDVRDQIRSELEAEWKTIVICGCDS